jgi:hypothetical protein
VCGLDERLREESKIVTQQQTTTNNNKQQQTTTNNNKQQQTTTTTTTTTTTSSSTTTTSTISTHRMSGSPQPGHHTRIQLIPTDARVVHVWVEGSVCHIARVWRRLILWIFRGRARRECA